MQKKKRLFMQILIIDSNPTQSEQLLKMLSTNNHFLCSVCSKESGLQHLVKRDFDIILCDVQTAFFSQEEISKYLNTTKLIYVGLQPNLQKRQIPIESSLQLPISESRLQHLLDDQKKPNMIAESPSMKKLLCDVEKIAKSNANIFITGESGTGKEVISSLIHYYSNRAHRPFIKVNCAALVENLVESEFFGHEKGSFTGAIKQRIGRLELADKGTLLLDEISEVPLSFQAKLLRAVQEMEFERVGGTSTLKVDVRFIATSNQNMLDAISNKTFREDLYYRLNVIPLSIPPLRDRKEDILPLAEHFLFSFCQKENKKPKILTEKAKELLQSYSWPGNIRQLANSMEHAVALSDADEIDFSLFSSLTFQKNLPFKSGMTLKQLEKIHLLQTLQNMQNNRTKTASALGISVRTLRNKLNEYKKD